MKKALLIITLLIQGCASYQETISSDVFVREHSALGYSLQFTVEIEGRGNIHNLFNSRLSIPMLSSSLSLSPADELDLSMRLLDL